MPVEKAVPSRSFHMNTHCVLSRVEGSEVLSLGGPGGLGQLIPIKLEMNAAERSHHRCRQITSCLQVQMNSRPPNELFLTSKKEPEVSMV